MRSRIISRFENEWTALARPHQLVIDMYRHTLEELESRFTRYATIAFATAAIEQAMSTAKACSDDVRALLTELVERLWWRWQFEEKVEGRANMPPKEARTLPSVQLYEAYDAKLVELQGKYAEQENERTLLYAEQANLAFIVWQVDALEALLNPGKPFVATCDIAEVGWDTLASGLNFAIEASEHPHETFDWQRKTITRLANDHTAPSEPDQNGVPVGREYFFGESNPGGLDRTASGDLARRSQPIATPAELMAAGRTPPASAAGPDLAGGMQTEEGEADGDAPLPGPPWTEDNVGVDAVATGEELSPELSEELLQMTGGGDGEVSFGESEDGSRSLESILGMEGQAQGSQGAQATQGTQGAQGQSGADPQAAYHDGLTPRERAGVKWDAMKKGLSDWWSQNWPYVLAGGVLAVAGFIVANILTGGAILAALPAIMTAVGYIFTGLMVVQLAGHLRDYLQKGWNGDIQGGGKSLAKGLAAGAIELITLLTFKVGSVALKGAKAAAKGVAKGAQAVARGTANVARGAMRIARRGAQYVLEGGKVLLRGAGQGISRGVKRLRDLGARLLQRTRFKGFRIRIQARRFRLEGKINPWVKVMEGKLVEVPEGTPGAKWIDDDLWATGRLQRNFSKSRKSLSEVDEARRAKDARRQAHEARTEANTRQREQALNDRGEAIEKLKQVDQPLENTTKTRSSHGHGHRDHGFQTGLDDHLKRVTTGKGPSGHRGRSGRGPTSSAKFYNPEAELEALRKAENKLQEMLESGQLSKLDDGGQPARIDVVVTSDHPRGFGGGYRAKTAMDGKLIRHHAGGYQAEPVKKIKSAIVVFEHLPSSDTWVPVTYYPLIK